MSVYVGDRVSLGIGKETTRGTAVDAGIWVPSTSFDFNRQINSQNIEGTFGKIISTEDTKILQDFGQGTLGMDLRANAVGYLLLSMMGSVSTSTVSGSVKDHTFSLVDSNSHPTLTLIVDDPNKQESFARSLLESMTFNFSAENVATVEAGFMSDPPSDTTRTPSFSQDYVFPPGSLTFKLASSQSGLSGASATHINNLTLEISTGSDPDFGSDSNTPDDIYNTRYEISGSFERVFDGDTEHDLIFDNTSQAMRISWADTNTDIGSGNNPELEIDLYKVNFTTHTRDISLGDIVRQTVEFTGHYSISDDAVMDATLRNDHSSY